MELMEKFEVAFALKAPDGPSWFSRERQQWLIPELLSEVQPSSFDEFRASGVKKLRFTYPEALPPGLLPRLIVRTHAMSELHPEWRWRSGVVLEWAGCRALVRLDRQQRRTDVAVIEGAFGGGQGLFDIIRSHLNTLHGNVLVVEEVQVVEDPEKWVAMVDLRLAELEEDRELKVTVGKVPNARRIALPVVATLNGVESEAARIAAGPNPEPPMQLVVSYAHASEREIQPFRPHLTLLSQQGYIQAWSDRDLVAGEDWQAGIIEMLGRSDIVLFFYTTAAWTSRFIQDRELPIALARSDAGECTIIWVPLDRNSLDDRVERPIERRVRALQCATLDARPIHQFDQPSQGWLQVEQAIRRAVVNRRERRAKQSGGPE